MATSIAKMVDNDQAPSILSNAFPRASMTVSYNRFKSTNETQETDVDHDSLDLTPPPPATNDIAGYLARIQNLIDNRQSAHAIGLAMEALEKFDDIPEAAYDELMNKIDESLTYINIYGTQHEADMLKRRILENINLSSRWGDNLIENLDKNGFASVVAILRAENTSDVNAPSVGVNRHAVPTLGFAA